MGHFNEENDYEPADLGGILRQAHKRLRFRSIPIDLCLVGNLYIANRSFFFFYQGSWKPTRYIHANLWSMGRLLVL